jgi:DNA primase
LVSSCYTLGITNVDIIELVEKIKDIYFVNAIKWICDICGWEYYEEEFQSDSNELFDWLDKIEVKKYKLNEDSLRCLSEDILDQYEYGPNIWLYNEGISAKTQKEWEIHYDKNYNNIVYPIRDELGNLIGVKARCLSNPDYKFVALCEYPKSEILYGLYRNIQNIKEKNEVICVEAEKGVLILSEMGFNNVVATGGHAPSPIQTTKLIRLNVDIVWAYDNDIWTKKEDKESFNEVLQNTKMFAKQYVVYDKWEKLELKDSPYDCGLDTWKFLYEKKFQIK